MKKKWPIILAILVVSAVAIVYPALLILALILAFIGSIPYLAWRMNKKEKELAAQKEAEQKAAEEARLKEIAEKEAARKAEEERLAAEAAKNKEPETVLNKYEVTGVVFYLKNLLAQMEPNYLWDYKKQDLIDTCNYDVPIYKDVVMDARLELTHEPDNPHDPNAIMVLLNDRLVGYIAAKDCKHLLHVMDNDLIVSISCDIYGGKYKILNEDYDALKDKSTYTMDRGEDEYGITIYIREKVE